MRKRQERQGIFGVKYGYGSELEESGGLVGQYGLTRGYGRVAEGRRGSVCQRGMTRGFLRMGMLLCLTVMLICAAFLTAPSGRAQAATPIQGIDVSRWQGTIDWEKVKASGVEFVMIGTGRYTNGVSIPDPYFDQNMQGAIDAGLKVGVYHLITSTTVSDVRDAADYVLDLVQGYEISYPIAVDIEDSSTTTYSSMTTAKRTKLVKAFMQVIANAGYYPVLYTSESWFIYYLDLTELTSYDFWVANWSSQPTLTNMTMWQYSSTGTVSGISTVVDLDYSYKDYSTIITPRRVASSRRTSDGWQSDGTYFWYVDSDGVTATNTWLTVNSKTYYVDSNGYRVTGWAKIGGKYYYFQKSTGVMQTGWVTISGKTYYLDPTTGERQTGWLTVDGSTYYLRKSSSQAGQMATGWVKISGQYYYFDTDTGVMQTGWTTVDDNIYYLDSSTGARVTGWLTLGDNTYYLRRKSSPKGIRASGWTKISGKYYYFDPDTGVMQTGLTTISGKKYYFDPDTGARVTGWVTINGNQYYFRKATSPAGQMASGWTKISGKYYYFDTTTGVMWKNTTRGKYILGADGACTNR